MHQALESLVVIATSMAQWVDAMSSDNNNGPNDAAEDDDEDDDEAVAAAAQQVENEAAKFDKDRKEKHIIVKGLEMFADNPSSGVITQPQSAHRPNE